MLVYFTADDEAGVDYLCGDGGRLCQMKLETRPEGWYAFEEIMPEILIRILAVEAA